MGKWDAEVAFNTGGKDKCPHCGQYFSSAHIYTHMDKCVNNPANQEEENE